MFYWLPMVVAVLVKGDMKLNCCDNAGPKISLFLTYFEWDKGLFKLSEWKRSTSVTFSITKLGDI